MSQFISTQHIKSYPALTSFVTARPLAGQSALVTGASRGVGSYIVEALASAGASPIAITGRDEARIHAAAAKYAEKFPSTIFKAFAADATDEAAITSLFESFGAPDILINNAGDFPDEGPFVSHDLKRWWKGFEINILGTANVTQKFLRAKPANKKAIILTVSTNAAHMRFPLTGWSGYCSSKLGQVRIMEFIKNEHPEVLFISAHPGVIQSDGFGRSGLPEPEGGFTDGRFAGDFYVWLAGADTQFLNGRYVWAAWDIEELKAKEAEIVNKNLLLTTIDGFVDGY